MDDTAQTSPPSSDDQAQQPVNPQQDQHSGLQAIAKVPSSPISVPGREAGPAMNAPVVEAAPMMEASDRPPEISQEVQEAGVEVSPNSEVPDLTIQDQKAGITHAPVLTPVPTSPSNTISSIMTEEVATQTLKKSKKPTNSITWLAIAFLRQLKLMKEEKKGDTHA